MKPIVSVIMPAHNAVSFIESSIDSVIQQSFPEWELIIIDDASTDATAVTVQKYLSDSRVRLISLENNFGAARARNIGSEAAIGEYLAFLDSDDIWERSKLAIQVSYHRENPTIALSHTNYVHLLPNGMTRKRFRSIMTPRRKKSGLVFPLLLYHNCIGTLTVMIKKDIFDRYSGFDPTIMGGTEDWDLWLRISEDRHTIGYLNRCLAMYRINPAGLTKKNIVQYEQSLRAVLEKHLRIANPKKSIVNNSYANLLLIIGVTYRSLGSSDMSNALFCRAIRLMPNDVILLFQLCCYCIASGIWKYFRKS